MNAPIHLPEENPTVCASFEEPPLPEIVAVGPPFVLLSWVILQDGRVKNIISKTALLYSHKVPEIEGRSRRACRVVAAHRCALELHRNGVLLVLQTERRPVDHAVRVRLEPIDVHALPVHEHAEHACIRADLRAHIHRAPHEVELQRRIHLRRLLRGLPARGGPLPVAARVRNAGIVGGDGCIDLSCGGCGREGHGVLSREERRRERGT